MSSKLASRYAKALFQSGEKEQRNGVLQCLDAILLAYEKFPELKLFLESPEVPLSKKESSLKKIFGKQLNDFNLHFFILLLQKGRFHYLQEIAVQYRQLYTESYGITNVELRTPVAVDETVKEKLKQKLEKRFNKTFIITNVINPKMIGGGILVIGERMIDFSIRGKLNKLKIALLS